MDIEQVELPPLRVLAFRRTGPYGPGVGEAYGRLCGLARRDSLLNETSLATGAYYDRPPTCAPEKRRMDACLTPRPRDAAPAEDGFRTDELPGGVCVGAPANVRNDDFAKPHGGLHALRQANGGVYDATRPSLEFHSGPCAAQRPPEKWIIGILYPIKARISGEAMPRRVKNRRTAALLASTLALLCAASYPNWTLQAGDAAQGAETISTKKESPMKSGIALIEEIRTAKVENGKMALWWLGQMSFAVKTPGATIAIDPYLAPSPKRLVPPLFAPEEAQELFDAILCTHDHSDHIDRQTLPALLKANPSAKLLIPRAIDRIDELGAQKNQLVLLDDEEAWEGSGLKVTAVKAAHELFNKNERGYQNLSYVVECGGASLLHTGDACIYDGLSTFLKKRWPKLSAAILPINGRDAVRYKRGCIGNMTYQEAADLAGILRPGLTIPGHFEMFEGNKADPQLFLDYMAVKYPGLTTRAAKHGERLDCGG